MLLLTFASNLSRTADVQSLQELRVITVGNVLQSFMAQLGLIAVLTDARPCQVAVCTLGTAADPDVASRHILFLPGF